MFSEQDQAGIRAAVEAAERRTRGEIVPMVVPRSAVYRETRHLAGLMLALVALAGLLAVDGFRSNAFTIHRGWIVVGVVFAYVLGHWLGTVPACIRLLTPDARMAMKVRLRAERAFFEHGLHKTREGTGVLIFVSLLERRVQILADRALDERVPPGTWDGVARQLVHGIREGQAAHAFVSAIHRCGDLLAVHFPPRPGSNPNELPDDLIRER